MAAAYLYASALPVSPQDVTIKQFCMSEHGRHVLHARHTHTLRCHLHTFVLSISETTDRLSHLFSVSLSLCVRKYSGGRWRNSHGNIPSVGDARRSAVGNRYGPHCAPAHCAPHYVRPFNPLFCSPSLKIIRHRKYLACPICQETSCACRASKWSALASDCSFGGRQACSGAGPRCFIFYIIDALSA